MRPIMYIVANKGAGMSPGKLAAQAAHAAVEAYIDTPDTNLKRVWHRGGHYTKIILQVPSTEALLAAERYVQDRGFRTSLIIDEGRTEVDCFTPTCFGVEIVDKDHAHAAATFSSFELYRDVEPRPEPDALAPSSRWPNFTRTVVYRKGRKPKETKDGKPSRSSAGAPRGA